ncbi:MAG: hypothetical protein PHQ74_07950 [Crocinitomicaceae bacterium]|nr:hypothetical protein [Crocinitomicaceae bacterium]
MKNKIGFNIMPALLAFVLAMALNREFNFETFTFQKPALGILYLVTFIFFVISTFKKKKVTGKEGTAGETMKKED